MIRKIKSRKHRGELTLIINSFIILIVSVIFICMTQYLLIKNKVTLIEDTLTACALGGLKEEADYVSLIGITSVNEKETYDNICDLLAGNLSLTQAGSQPGSRNRYSGNDSMFNGSSCLTKVWIFHYNEKREYVCAQYNENGIKTLVKDLHESPQGENVEGVSVFVEYVFPMTFLGNNYELCKGSLVTLCEI